MISRYKPAALRALQSNLRIVNTRLREDWDCFVIIDGGERRGKTVLASHIVRLAQPEIDEAILCGDYEPFLARSHYDWDTMEDWVEDAVKGSVVAYHEAMLLGREAMSAFNLRAIRWISTIGHKNLLHVWTWTRFHRFDPVIRERCAVRGCILQEGRGRRGLVRWYIRKELPDPLPGYNESIIHIPALEERFPSMDAIGPNHAEAWALLCERDDEAKRRLRAEVTSRKPEVKAALALAESGFTPEQIAKSLEVPPRRVARWLAAFPTESST